MLFAARTLDTASAAPVNRSCIDGCLRCFMHR